MADDGLPEYSSQRPHCSLIIHLASSTPLVIQMLLWRWRDPKSSPFQCLSGQLGSSDPNCQPLFFPCCPFLAHSSFQAGDAVSQARAGKCSNRETSSGLAFCCQQPAGYHGYDCALPPKGCSREVGLPVQAVWLLHSCGGANNWQHLICRLARLATCPLVPSHWLG